MELEIFPWRNSFARAEWKKTRRVEKNACSFACYLNQAMNLSDLAAFQIFAFPPSPILPVFLSVL